jgi:hypothetical protein
MNSAIKHEAGLFDWGLWIENRACCQEDNSKRASNRSHMPDTSEYAPGSCRVIEAQLIQLKDQAIFEGDYVATEPQDGNMVKT